MPTIPPMPVRLKRAALELARQPLAAVPVGRLPRIWELSEAEAGAVLADLIRRNMVRGVERPGDRPRAVSLTDFGALVAGYRPCPSGVRLCRETREPEPAWNDR